MEERRLNGVLCDKTFLIAMLCLFAVSSYRGIVLELLLSEVFKDERINEGAVKVQAAHLQDQLENSEPADSIIGFRSRNIEFYLIDLQLEAVVASACYDIAIPIVTLCLFYLCKFVRRKVLTIHVCDAECLVDQG